MYDFNPDGSMTKLQKSSFLTFHTRLNRNYITVRVIKACYRPPTWHDQHFNISRSLHTFSNWDKLLVF